MTWYDAVKWCNARSEQEGWPPAYYTDAGLTAPYWSGEVEPYVKWSSGYRLPTEAEWEKAARGGVSGKRFPWGNTISWDQANYYSFWRNGASICPYDLAPTEGYDPAFNDGVFPGTNPVGYFAPNGYGLYDMAGNAYQWCWDRYDGTYCSSSPASDPRGPGSGLGRVGRGGGWGDSAFYCRTAGRAAFDPRDSGEGSWDIGFRCALPPGQ